MTLTNRIGVIGVVHETNSFAPGLTHLSDFQVTMTEQFDTRFRGTRTSMGGVIDAAAKHGIKLVAGAYFDATPSGMVTDETAEQIMNALVASIPPNIEGLIVILHGAMVAESYPDMEGEILSRVRAAAGANLPITVTLDLHANISESMVKMADIIVGYDTYPHTDIYDRAVEAFDLLLRHVRKEISPDCVLSYPNLLLAPESMLTLHGPFQELMAEAFRLEKADSKILNIVVAGGFPFSDVPDAGVAFVVITDNDPERGREYSQRLCELAWSMRERFKIRGQLPEEAVSNAAQIEEGPVILVESSDNVGGGAPGDATHVLQHLISCPKRSLIVIRDMEAVKMACSVGVGSAFRCHVGGKSDDMHGKPILIEGRVRMLYDGKYRHIGTYMTGKEADMGLTAVIEMNSVMLILTEKRNAPWDLGHIAVLGLRPEDFHLIVVKSAIAWKTAFGHVARSEIVIDSPGCCSYNLQHFTYHRLKRPVFPIRSSESRR